MVRSPTRIVLPPSLALGLSLTLSLYACSGGEEGSAPAGDAGSEASESGASDGSGNAATDGGGLDGATAGDAASDASDAGLDADAPLDAEVDAGPPAVRFIGRFDTTPAAGPKVAFPGSRIVARFTGPEVKATFADAMVYNDYGPTRWEVLVDGVAQPALAINRAQTTYTLAQGLGAGAHTVELVKLTEASVGISQFLGFDLPGGTLLPPPPAATRHLEFLGDSASNGYGVEGADPSCNFSAATQNARKSYPALITADLGADHHNLGVSGKGVLRNYYHPDTDVFAVIYPRALPFTNGSMWSFADYTPDVVWLTVGGNDYDPGTPAAAAPDFDQFKAKYDELVTNVRAAHPNAHIVCSVAPSLTDAYPAGFSAYTSVKTAATSVVAAHVGAGDTKLYVFEFTRSIAADLTGCEYHPNTAKHRAMADEAIAFIKSKTGWP